MRNSLTRPAALFMAGILGAVGVASAAAASHSAEPRLLAAASAMCLAHAPALIALYAACPSLRSAGMAILLLSAGTSLFAADLFMRHFLAHGLFPMSAPLGGMVMIAGWLAVAAGAFFRRTDA